MAKENFFTKIGKALNLIENEKPSKQSERIRTADGTENYWFSVSFNGEKTYGEVGPIKDYKPHYQALRIRSWQLQFESKIAKMAMTRIVTWVVGNGLKLQSEPVMSMLKDSGINITTDFSKRVETRFNLFKKTKLADIAGARSLDKIANVVYKNAKIGGDILVVLRYIDKMVKVQLIDGAHVQSPEYGTEWFPKELSNGNRIINGIEQNSSGEHIRYWIKQANNEYTSVEAKVPGTNIQCAFLVYGSEHRLDNNRGVPLISAMIETLMKLNRYEEATVSSAEERAKLVMFIKHGDKSDGSNPFEGSLAKSWDTEGNNEDIPEDVNGTVLRSTVLPSLSRTAVNMPKGAELDSLDSKNDLYFKDFFTVNIEIFCAALGFPPEVILQKYNSNYSASRAALKDLEMTLGIERKGLSEEFYQPVFNYWLYMEILEMRLPAPGYIQALNAGNHMIIEAYRNARFIGPAVPHIDPVKEVTAQRMKLGSLGQHLPLTTLEQATEELQTGESRENIDQFSREIKEAETAGLKAVPANPNVPPAAPGD